ncbi:extracellular solute-binding protein [Paenibacillus harenae]|uniref:extracellular solute-binding protein n=1 Tax=Paenibacillus harenae TaxID=306543 RepID=UPI0004008250|nr:extracellular solute-binding protein [Paenibacillus harenae]
MKTNRVHGSKMVGLIVLIIMLAVTACSGNNGAPANAPSSGNQQKDNNGNSAAPKKVSISMFDRGQVSSDEGTYEENRWVDWIREQSGIDVTFAPVPRNKAQDTLNIMIASGQAPDLIWEYDRNYIGRLVSQGAIQPVGEYIEKYSTSYKKYLEENPELVPYLTFNGEMYAVASKRAITAVANHAMWIRQDWLDELDLKAPTTVEELVEVAKKFKEHYPDSTPIVGGNKSDIYAALNGASFNHWYLEDGKMKFGATLDRYGDAIALEKQLYDLGLVDREYLTDTTNQRSNQLWTTGKAGILLGQWSNEPLNRDLLTTVPDAKPVPLEAVSTKNGHYGTYQEAPPSFFIAFSKDMKDPETAVKYLDWLMDKGWYTLVNGMEGTHYEMVNGVPKQLDGAKFEKEVRYAAEYAVLRQEGVKAEDLPLKAADDPLSQQVAQLSAAALNTALLHEFRRDIPFQPNFDEINEIRSTFDTFLNEIRAKATTQGPKYTAEWALGEIRKEWERLGGAKAEEVANAWYEENKSTFE